jgi:hypothetical protein
MRSTFKILFYLKKNSLRPDGTVPVMGRITIDGTICQFSCKMNVPVNLWDTKAGRLTGKSALAIKTNLALDKIRVDINRHYQEAMRHQNTAYLPCQQAHVRNFTDYLTGSSDRNGEPDDGAYQYQDDPDLR